MRLQLCKRGWRDTRFNLLNAVHSDLSFWVFFKCRTEGIRGMPPKEVEAEHMAITEGLRCLCWNYPSQITASRCDLGLHHEEVDLAFPSRQSLRGIHQNQPVHGLVDADNGHIPFFSLPLFLAKRNIVTVVKAARISITFSSRQTPQTLKYALCCVRLPLLIKALSVRRISSDHAKQIHSRSRAARLLF